MRFLIYYKKYGGPDMRMGLPPIISINCENMGTEVQVELKEWESTMDGNEEVVNFRTDSCPCGVEHFGFARFVTEQVAK